MDSVFKGDVVQILLRYFSISLSGEAEEIRDEAE
jgi:hypothetical protein